MSGGEGSIVPLPQKAERAAVDKVLPLVELAEVSARARAAGQRVVLAHGAFDLLHIGHVRHLESARRQGDLLMVTVTGDQHINKGPDRPVFAEAMRAEMLAAMEIVDWVAISHYPTAEPVLDQLKPQVYAKGPDYRNQQDDVTGKIAAEQAAVEQHGGQLFITDDVTFSSSALINRYMDHQDPEVRECLGSLRQRHRIPEIVALLDSVAEMKVAIVGDTIIDEYNYVEPLGKSPKENMIATLARGGEVFAGGVIAAANHIAGLCAEVRVVTLLGERDGHEALVRESLKPNCGLTTVQRPDAPSTRKVRFIDSGYMRKLFEVYHMDDSPLVKPLQDEVDGRIEEAIEGADLVIAADFGHGLIGRSTVGLLTEKARFLAVNTQTNSANTGYNLVTKYPRADYVCIDAPEARLAIGDKFADIQEIVTSRLPARIDCQRIAVTWGRHGCMTNRVGEGQFAIPAFTKSVVDTVGAGDAFFTVTAPLAAVDAPMDLLGFIGNLAGAIKVGIVGHRRSVDRVSLIKGVTALMK